MAMIGLEYMEKAINTIQKTYKHEPLRSNLKESLKLLKTAAGTDTRLFLREHSSILDTMASLLETNKLPFAAIELLHTLLISDLFAQRHVSKIVNDLHKPLWSSQSRMKTLQMAFYFVRYDLYSGKEAYALLRFILDCLDSNDPHLDAAARPIATLLLDKILQKAVKPSRSACDIDIEKLKIQLINEKDKDRNRPTDGIKLETEASCLEASALSGAEGSANGNSKSTEDVREPCSAHLSNLTEILEYVNAAIHTKSMWSMGYVLPHVLKFPGVFTLPGIDEFVRCHAFILFNDILKHGRAEDKEAVYASIRVLQSSYSAMFQPELHSFYEKLPRYYDDRNVGFLKFVHGLFQLFVKQQASSLDEHEPAQEIPVQLYDIFYKALGELNVAKKSDAAKFSFLENTLGLFNGSLEIYNTAVNTILVKFQDAKEVNINIDRFSENALRSIAISGNVDLFDRILCICSVPSMVNTAIALRWFMKDSWFQVFQRTTHAQRRDSLLKRLGEFSPEELISFVKYVESEEVEMVFEEIRDKLLFESYLPVFYSLFKQADSIGVLSKLIIRFYSGLLNERPKGLKASGEYLQCKDFDPDCVVDGAGDSKVETVPLVPLNMLRAHLENNPEDYQKTLGCLNEIIQIVSLAGNWDILFAIVDTSRDSIDAQMPIMLSIVGNYIATLEDKHIIKILCIVKRMCRSQDNNTALNSLFIYQEIGEFLITKSILAAGDEGLPIADKKSDASIELWRDFIIIGAVMMKDSRMFVPVSIIKYVFAFIKAGYSIFTPGDFRFIDKVFLSQLLKAADAEVLMFGLDEMNDYSGRYSLREFSSTYMNFLVELLLGDNEAKAGKAFEGIERMMSGIHRSMNDVICSGEDSSPGIPADGDVQRPSPAEAGSLGSAFLIKRKAEVPQQNGVATTFTDLLHGMAEKTNVHLKGTLKLMPLFAYSQSEIAEFVQLLGRIVARENLVAQEAVECVEKICISSNARSLALTHLASWLNDSTLNMRMISDAKPLHVLLIERIGEIMRRVGWHPCFGAALKSIELFSKDEHADAVVNCLIRGCGNICTADDFELFTAYTLRMFRLGTFFEQTKTRERKLIEFITFYHSVIKSYNDRHGTVFKYQKTNPYDLVLLLTSKQYCQLRLKCYQILFSDISRCEDLLVAQLQTMFKAYAADFMSIGDLIDNTRVTEVLYCLRCLVILNDPALINKLKLEMTELFVCHDSDILGAVKGCFHIMFTAPSV